MRTVRRLSIAPVKSMGLVHPDEIRLERHGVPGNRHFYVTDENGRLLTGSKNGGLQAIRPEYDPRTRRLSLRFPDGTTVTGEASRNGRSMETSFHGRPVAGHAVDGPWSEALSGYVGREVLLAQPDARGAANDEAPASIFGTASAEELARRSGSDRALDSRRFRMLVEVEGGEPHEEDLWVGGRVRIGEALVEVVSLVARCVVTTLDPDTGRKDFDTLKAIGAYRGVRGEDDICFGVYADVAEPGRIRVGDRVEPPVASIPERER